MGELKTKRPVRLSEHVSATMELEAAIKAFRGMDEVLSPQQIMAGRAAVRLEQHEIDAAWERVELLKQIKK